MTAKSPSFAEAIREVLDDDPQAQRLIEMVDDSVLDIEAEEFSRKVARDRFNRLADTGQVSLVTKHNDIASATVMMRLVDLAQLLVRVVGDAKAKAERPPLVSMLEGLQPVPLAEGAVNVPYDTDHERHALHVDSTLVDVKESSVTGVHPDAPLAAIIGNKPMPRTEVTKKLWAYIKKHGLQGPKNTDIIKADARLRQILGGKRQISTFELMTFVDKHLK